MKAGEVVSVARLAGALAFPAYQRGRVATVKRWLGWLEDRAAMESYPAIAVLAAVFCALAGGPTLGETRARGRPRGTCRHATAGREPVGRAVAGADPGAAVPRRGGADAGRRGGRGQGHGPWELLAGHVPDVPAARALDSR